MIRPGAKRACDVYFAVEEFTGNVIVCLETKKGTQFIGRVPYNLFMSVVEVIKEEVKSQHTPPSEGEVN